jgi:hypothetical protein
MSGSAGMSPFPVEALEANRAGRLTETQRKKWTGADRDWRGNVRLMALVLGFAGVLLAAGIGQTPFPTFARLPLGAVCLLVAAYLVYVSTLGGGALTRDLCEGRVETVEPIISPISGSMWRAPREPSTGRDADCRSTILTVATCRHGRGTTQRIPS